MRLTPSFLNDVKYWEYKITKNFVWGYKDKFTFHFKQWWKPSKVIKFNYSEHWDGDTCHFQQSSSGRNLVDQLNNYKF